MKKTTIFTLLIIFLAWGLAFYFYPQMPAQMASHWNVRGEVDGYMSKFWGLFLMPLMTVGCYLLFIFLPRIDPLKKNIDKFRIYYDGFILILMLFFLYLYGLTLLWNLGYRFDMTLLLVPVFALLFYYLGILIHHAERNWFIGIRTPWTMSSDEVWRKTHLLGGRLFKIAGVLALVGLFVPDYSFWITIIPVIGFTAYLVVYSYMLFRKRKERND